MVQSSAPTIADYLLEIGEKKATVIQVILKAIENSIQPGFDQCMNWGMITFEVPLSVYPNTYNKRPLMYCALAVQKNYYSLYLMNVYEGTSRLKQLQDGYAKAGLTLNMGKCCIRFKTLEQIHLPTIEKLVGAFSVDAWVVAAKQCKSLL